MGWLQAGEYSGRLDTIQVADIDRTDVAITIRIPFT